MNGSPFRPEYIALDTTSSINLSSVLISEDQTFGIPIQAQKNDKMESIPGIIKNLWRHMHQSNNILQVFEYPSSSFLEASSGCDQAIIVLICPVKELHNPYKPPHD